MARMSENETLKHGGRQASMLPFFVATSSSVSGVSMNRLFLKFAMMFVIGGLLYSTTAATQVSPTTKKAASIKITKGPEPERIDPNFAIITWTSNNPGGTPEHFGVVRYGTDPA